MLDLLGNVLEVLSGLLSCSELLSRTGSVLKLLCSDFRVDLPVLFAGIHLVQESVLELFGDKIYDYSSSSAIRS